MEIPHMITIPIIYIFLMIAILAIYFKNNSIKETKAKLKLADYPFPIQIYAYNNVPKRRLFCVTFIYLIDRGFYKIKKRNGISYIEVSNVNKESLNNCEKKVLTYLNNIIKDKQLTIDQFEFLVKTNLQYGHVRMEFLEEIKKVATKRLGKIDHISDYMAPFIISMLYFMQVLYFINKSFDISILLLLALPLSVIFVFVA